MEELALFMGKKESATLNAPILEMRVNGASTMFDPASWIITGLCNGINP